MDIEKAKLEIAQELLCAEDVELLSETDIALYLKGLHSIEDLETIIFEKGVEIGMLAVLHA